MKSRKCVKGMQECYLRDFQRYTDVVAAHSRAEHILHTNVRLYTVQGFLPALNLKEKK